ncbi:MAG: type II secretion system protein M [Gammaproteobacteria bacterium]|jgi:general secretion pathway protein M
MRAWFEGLDQRERLLVMAGSALLAVFLVIVLVWLPVRSGYNSLKASVAEQRDTAAWMQRSAQQLAELKRSGGTAAVGLGGRSLLAVTDSTARAGGLGAELKRVEPEGRDSVRVWLDGAPFDVLVKWLTTLNSTHGILVDNATLERTESAGRVDARLTLQATDL